jgi:hypothetical protein
MTTLDWVLTALGFATGFLLGFGATWLYLTRRNDSSR